MPFSVMLATLMDPPEDPSLLMAKETAVIAKFLAS